LREYTGRGPTNVLDGLPDYALRAKPDDE